MGSVILEALSSQKVLFWSSKTSPKTFIEGIAWEIKELIYILYSIIIVFIMTSKEEHFFQLQTKREMLANEKRMNRRKC